MLYQGVLTGIVRLQSGRQRLGDPNSLAKLMENLFKEIGKEARKLGYSDQDVEDANCAVAALLDETVQRLNESGREQWSPLLAKMFPQGAGTDAVYERLRAIRGRPESVDLADLLEVYYLCFLLGYEGRFAGRPRAELENLMEELRQQIEGIRGRRTALSPEGNLPRAEGVGTTAPPKPPATGKWVAIGSIAAAGLCWVVLRVLLQLDADAAVREMIFH